MELLTPSGGLLFWMTIAFAVVFFVLAKFAFPAILGSVEKREKYIDTQLDAARAAEIRIAGIEEEGKKIIADAEREKVNILKDAAASRDKIVGDARQTAQEEAARILAEAKKLANEEKEAILASARGEVAMIAMQMATKVLRGQLDDEQAQKTLQEILAGEVKS
ncbi:MAG: F0F1 ATP synthase subunit B [Bacteroidales bacterium]|nr:F0F1 ATP synthase subunit B [Bacteroidales bacterium]MBQ7458247.1 F0F1 ATP synthase subunit B [Bacteroidales bacterium]